MSNAFRSFGDRSIFCDSKTMQLDLILFVQTAYVNTKKGNLATPTGEQAPINTPEANNGTVSTDNVAQQNPDVKYSLSDSDGRQLTAEQQEYFKDSKVRDENGNLLTVYHTTNNDFTVFDKARKGETTQDSNTYLGFFFADDAEYMQNFPEFQDGKTEAYYLNIRNPIQFERDSTKHFYVIRDTRHGYCTFQDKARGHPLIDAEQPMPVVAASLLTAKQLSQKNSIENRLLHSRFGWFFGIKAIFEFNRSETACATRKDVDATFTSCCFQVVSAF